MLCNYPNSNYEEFSRYGLDKVHCDTIRGLDNSGHKIYYTSVECDENSQKDKIRVAIGSVRLSIEDFKSAMDGNPNRRYERKCLITTRLDKPSQI